MVAPKAFFLFVTLHFQLVLELYVCMVHRYVKSRAPVLRLKWSRLQLEKLTVRGECVIKYDKNDFHAKALQQAAKLWILFS